MLNNYYSLQSTVVYDILMFETRGKKPFIIIKETQYALPEAAAAAQHILLQSKA